MNSKEKMKYTSEKGITLIALVITIIVLLILAGVTISMVLGDDGIIAQAQEAEQKYGKASKVEEAEVNGATLQIDLISEGNTELKAGGGVLAGIEAGDTVETLLSKLPEGYTMKETGTLKTGMEVYKGDIIVARTLIYGDVGRPGVAPDGLINAADRIAIGRFIRNVEGYSIENWEEYQILAMDLDNNKIINYMDVLYVGVVSAKHDLDTYQNRQPIGIKSLKIETISDLQKEYIEILKANDYEVVTENEQVKVKGVTNISELMGTTGILPSGTVIVDSSGTEQADVASGDIIGVKYVLGETEEIINLDLYIY